MEAKGYFAFVQQAGGIVDQIVTNYSEDDVAALGDNVVLILDTVKEMTQMRDPQVRLGLQRALGMLKSISGSQPDSSKPQERK